MFKKLWQKKCKLPSSFAPCPPLKKNLIVNVFLYLSLVYVLFWVSSYLQKLEHQWIKELPNGKKVYGCSMTRSARPLLQRESLAAATGLPVMAMESCQPAVEFLDTAWVSEVGNTAHLIFFPLLCSLLSWSLLALVLCPSKFVNDLPVEIMALALENVCLMTTSTLSCKRIQGQESPWGLLATL